MAASAEFKTALNSQFESAGTQSINAGSPPNSRMTLSESTRIRLAQKLAVVASVGVIVLGAAVLAGWALNISWLKSLVPSLPVMKANTAVCFLVAGIALWLLRAEPVSLAARRAAQICALLVAVIGALTLSQYVFGWNLHIDQILFREVAGSELPFPGRMALTTALNFLLLGTSLLLIDSPATSKALAIKDFPTLLAAALTLVALFGLIYQAETPYPVVPHATMTPHAIAGFLLLTAGIFLSRPTKGLTTVFLSDTIAGILARRLFPVAIFLPPLLGGLRLMGERRGLYGAGFGVALVASVLVVVLITRIGLTAGLLNRLESGRRRAEEKMRLMFEAAPSAMIMIDDRGSIALANAQAESLFGYPRSELLGQSVAKLMAESKSGENSDRQQHFWELFTDGNRAGRVWYGRRKNGGEIPIELNFNRIQTDEGDFVLANITDITIRKGAQDALQKSEERARRGQRIWEKTFDAMGEGILVHDDQMRIVRCNAQAAEMLNMTHASVIGLSFNEAFARLFGRQSAAYYLDQNRNDSASFEAVTTAGRRCIVSIFPIKQPDGDSVSVVTWADVTRLAEVQEQLGKSRRLASVGQLAAGVAHEVNNPLAAITTCAEAIMRDLKRNAETQTIGESSQWNYYLEEIVRQALRCKEITRGLLDLTRQRQAKRILTDINAATKQCAKVALQRAGSNVEFEIHLDENIGEVATDVEMVRQTLDNLLANAIDAVGEDGGKITVSTARQSDKVVIDVADNGSGIPESLLAKIFDPFFSTKGPGKGYGLGLAICLTMAESLSGGITVETKQGAGSRFRLWIPRRAPE